MTVLINLSAGLKHPVRFQKKVVAGHCLDHNATKQYALANENVEIELMGYQMQSWSNAGGPSCGEVCDFLLFALATDLQDGFADKDASLAFFRALVNQGKSLSFIAKQMNDYLLEDTLKWTCAARRLSKNRDPTTEKSLLAIFPEHFR